MKLIPSGVLSQLQAINSANMPEVAVIQTGTETSDGSGGTAIVWADTATTKCRISPMSTGMVERISALGVEAIESFRLAFPTGTEISEAQRVVVGDRTFHVAAVLGPISYGSEVTVIGIERGA
jgi:SPP1 family predicted phage head-tail adaptor